MPHPASDRNLLFGILALQIDFVSRDALIAAMNTWVLDKAKPLGQILREQGQLADDEHALLDGLVRKHLEKHGNDPQRSLAALSSVGSVRRDLQQVADADVQASLAHVSAVHNGDDPYATRATTAGVPTGSGLRYSILRPHARGGLGEVFVARDEELRREVALKEIQERHADHPESRARFLLEAEVTGGLEHPGIVPVYGLGHYGDGRPFYAMRFIRGDSLQDAIRRFHHADKDANRDRGQRTLELRQLLGRFVDVCQAIAYAHSRGVLHRDLKPGNVMLGQYGETLVVDWGLAKALGRPEGKGSVDQGPLQPASESGSLPTQMGSALGTPAYMSPEQAAGRLDLLGAASDVYSLGATLYALLTGRAPFEGNDAGAVLQGVRRGDFPPPRQVNNTVPPALDAVCRKAMALRPEDRYASAEALADDVEHWLADEHVAAYPEPWSVRAGRWARRHRTAVTGAVAAVAVAAACLTVATLLLAAANQREQQAKQKAEQKEQDATAALGRETEAKKAVQKALTDLEARQSQLARSFCEVSDREFRN
ncbi:MAG TPA: protein kinase, partial [Gemmataceae bacterium]|nr:protein kinase [Gemmataceae bacterium]